ncbi:hypothetical protein PanWU01x14_101750 [Parasponia andersonii]|uniref:Uncharacterized protein n=1 Tax=Parasponia andersonii TaxID=3476 RepID=A0A2P5D2N6_PARAD|nr:hypothetical protein PanWU01x14_101750 [Parasponia andersonii]
MELILRITMEKGLSVVSDPSVAELTLRIYHGTDPSDCNGIGSTHLPRNLPSGSVTGLILRIAGEKGLTPASGLDCLERGQPLDNGQSFAMDSSASKLIVLRESKPRKFLPVAFENASKLIVLWESTPRNSCWWPEKIYEEENCAQTLRKDCSRGSHGTTKLTTDHRKHLSYAQFRDKRQESTNPWSSFLAHSHLTHVQTLGADPVNHSTGKFTNSFRWNGLEARFSHLIDIHQAYELSETRAKSTRDPGRVRPIPILTSTAGDQESRGSSTRRSWGQLTTPDLDRLFIAILGKCVHWANCPYRTTICQNLTLDRLESLETTENKSRQCKGNHDNHSP